MPTVAHRSRNAHIERLLRELAPQVLGALMHRFGDFASAEDAVQEALLAASEQWPQAGIPDSPRAWLVQVAFRRMTDQVRSQKARARREERAFAQLPDDEQFAPAVDSALEPAGDDTLILLFMCCHPALSQASSIALTLRAVGGLTTSEIAKAFLVPEATMAQRISRAKQTIKNSGIPFREPDEHERRARLGALLHVLYLIFNEGYASSAGSELSRTELSSEAIRLTRAVHALLPEECEVAGLLSLMLLTDARHLARTGPNGELIPLNEQDRSLWNQAAIGEGVALLSETLPKGAVGPYQLHAAIQAVHDEAASVEETDWRQILALYTVLENISDNPMITLNRAVAVAMVHGPGAGLELLHQLDRDERLAGHHRLDAVRAHLHEMGGDKQRAATHYRAAAEKTTSLPERHYLLMRASKLSHPHSMR